MWKGLTCSRFDTAVGNKGVQGMSPGRLLSPTVSCGLSLPEKLLGLAFSFYHLGCTDETQVARLSGEHLSLMSNPADWMV